MIKWFKENFRILIPIVFVALFGPVLYAAQHWNDSDPMKYGARYICTLGEWKKIIKDAKIAIAPHSSGKCTKYSNYVIVNIYDGYALLDVRPDMKECITDPIYLVLKLIGKDWIYVTLNMGLGIDWEGPDIPNEIREIPEQLWKIDKHGE